MYSFSVAVVKVSGIHDNTLNKAVITGNKPEWKFLTNVRGV